MEENQTDQSASQTIADQNVRSSILDGTTKQGVYRQTGDSSSNSGFLIVLQDGVFGDIIRQIYCMDDSKVYFRAGNNETWTSWVILTPADVADANVDVDTYSTAGFFVFSPESILENSPEAASSASVLFCIPLEDDKTMSQLLVSAEKDNFAMRYQDAETQTWGEWSFL